MQKSLGPTHLPPVVTAYANICKFKYVSNFEYLRDST